MSEVSSKYYFDLSMMETFRETGRSNASKSGKVGREVSHKDKPDRKTNEEVLAEIHDDSYKFHRGMKWKTNQTQ